MVKRDTTHELFSSVVARRELALRESEAERRRVNMARTGEEQDKVLGMIKGR